MLAVAGNESDSFRWNACHSMRGEVCVNAMIMLMGILDFEFPSIE